jgi:hypothetical protein
MLATASTTYAGVKVAAKTTTVAKRANVITRAGQYDDELLQTAVRASSSSSSSRVAVDGERGDIHPSVHARPGDRGVCG